MAKRKPKVEYIVTTKAGMVPYSTVTTLREARADARRAKKLGLDGKIVRYVTGGFPRPQFTRKHIPAGWNPRHGTARDIPAHWTPATVKRLRGGAVQIKIGGRR